MSIDRDEEKGKMIVYLFYILIAIALLCAAQGIIKLIEYLNRVL